jgi:hypothetical protein
MSSSSSSSRTPKSAVLWYVLFGALHEVSHILAAIVVGASGGLLNEGVPAFLYNTLLGRCVVLPDLQDNDAEWFVRHAGWITSLVVACVVRRFYSNSNNSKARHIVLASTLTAVEALWTDFCGLPVLAGLHSSPYATLFCGNFGIILLHNNWLVENGTSALNVLEKMVQVTMMRGAQSGGVITFHPPTNNSRACARALSTRNAPTCRH